MTPETMLSVVNQYRELFIECNIPHSPHTHETTPMSRDAALAHCHSMLPTIEKFIAEGRHGKAFRWLGFMQGVLWSQGIYTLEEMRQHNKASEK